ncbi:hypothetical protein A6F68_02045 [Tsuneonella dongtanensis]|uniref:Lipoprotein n=1 Tax=Tsuneonella dongtanensis TaxID=692370 RepID=A0A1B2AEF5_9SPHN|nr:hypothetical protein [Tsuneonella dongtanensis]ANY20550.1 hypothetical protein A6F68_02045 [Tsuneonella dongtanensis]
MRAFIPIFATAVLGACTVVPPPTSTPPQPQGYAVPFDVAVQVGELVVTPKKLVEDSRCPMNARCVWAGRVVVTARIVGPGFSDTANLTLGEPFGTHGKMLALVSVRPEKTTQAEIASRDYRFAFEAR